MQTFCELVPCAICSVLASKRARHAETWRILSVMFENRLVCASKYPSRFVLVFRYVCSLALHHRYHHQPCFLASSHQCALPETALDRRPASSQGGSLTTFVSSSFQSGPPGGTVHAHFSGLSRMQSPSVVRPADVSHAVQKTQRERGTHIFANKDDPIALTKLGKLSC